MKYKQLVKELKAQGKGLMSIGQYMRCAELIEIMSPCNLLVFGVGQDSYVWTEINEKGKTVFLEDDHVWAGKFNEFDVRNVVYHTEGKDHEKIGFDESKLKIQLPKDVMETSWDVVFIDGPLGHNPPRPYKGPGRMSSIYMGHKLLKTGGVAIVDDMGRLIERTYSEHYFGKENLMGLVEGKVGFYKKV